MKRLMVSMAAAAMCAAASADLVRAGSVRWTGGASGDLADESNWTREGARAGKDVDTARFTTSGTYSLSSDITFELITNANATQTFDLTDGNHKITLTTDLGTSLLKASYGFTTTVSLPNLAFRGGTWLSSTGNAVFNAATLARNQSGTALFTDGVAVTNFNSFLFGEHSAGMKVTVDGASVVYAKNVLSYATGKNNELLVKGGSRVVGTEIVSTDYSGTDGLSVTNNRITVTGAGSRLEAPGELYIGYTMSNDCVTAADGATIVAGNVTFRSQVATLVISNAEMTVSGGMSVIGSNKHPVLRLAGETPSLKTTFSTRLKLESTQHLVFAPTGTGFAAAPWQATGDVALKETSELVVDVSALACAYGTEIPLITSSDGTVTVVDSVLAAANAALPEGYAVALAGDGKSLYLDCRVMQQSLPAQFVTEARALYATEPYLSYTNSLLDDARYAIAARHDLPSNQFDVVTWYDVEGTRNFRDLGGWTGLALKKAIRGAECNSDKPEHAGTTIATKAGLEYLADTVGVKTELDLRGTGEWSANTSSIPRAAYVRIACGSYVDFFRGGGATVAAILRVFANAENLPVYFHCWGGADRTGSVAMLLEGLCGVSEIDMAIDYELTSFCNAFGGRRRYDWITFYYASALAYMREMPGPDLRAKFEYYALVRCGLSKEEVTAIRTNLGAADTSIFWTDLPYAGTVRWTGGASGDLADESNWTREGERHYKDVDTARFTTSGTYSLSSDISFEMITNENATQTFDLTDGDHTITLTTDLGDAISKSAYGFTTVAAPPASLTFRGGTWLSSTGKAVFNAATLTRNDRGTALFTDGVTVTNFYAFLFGEHSTGMKVTVDNGSLVYAKNVVNYASGRNNELIVRGGSRVVGTEIVSPDRSGTLGTATSNNCITVTGVGSRLEAPGTLYVGSIMSNDWVTAADGAAIVANNVAFESPAATLLLTNAAMTVSGGMTFAKNAKDDVWRFAGDTPALRTTFSTAVTFANGQRLVFAPTGSGFAAAPWQATGSVALTAASELVVDASALAARGFRAMPLITSANGTITVADSVLAAANAALPQNFSLRLAADGKALYLHRAAGFKILIR